MDTLKQATTAFLLMGLLISVGVVLPRCGNAMPPLQQAPYYQQQQQQQQPGQGYSGQNLNGYYGAGIYRVMTAPQGSSMILGGSVVAVREVTLTAQIPGRVEYIGGREGDWFAERSLIIGLSADSIEAERRRALAQLGSAESMLRNSRVQYSRELWAPQSRNVGRMPGMGLPSMFDQFFTRGFASNFGQGNPWLERQADLYGQSAQVNTAQAQMLQAHSGIDAVEAKLRDARTLASFSGVLTQKFVEIGDTVQPGEPLVSIADVSRLQIQVEVPVRIVGALQVGMPVPARLDVGGQIEARVAQIFPAAHANRHTVTVKLDLPERTPGGPGLYAEVMLPDGNATNKVTPVIPESAVIRRGSLPAVFVLDNQNKTRLRLVRLGEHLGNGFIPVLSGLKAGEQILAAPKAGYRAGKMNSAR